MGVARASFRVSGRHYVAVSHRDDSGVFYWAVVNPDGVAEFFVSRWDLAARFARARNHRFSVGWAYELALTPGV